jgi:hypothetical protein
MKNRKFAVLTLAILVLNLGASTFADSNSKKQGGNDLVALLPASDGVGVFDSKRFFGDALPKILASNQPLLAKITAKIDEFKAKTGIDMRQFDTMAVGATARRISEKNYDVDPVIIARGQIPSASLVGAAKLASKGKYREERVGDRVMYVFDGDSLGMKQSAENHLGKLGEIALTAIDGKTIAFGVVDRVSATLKAKTHVSPELVTMLEKDLSSVASFAIKPPNGLKEFLPLDNDELGKNIDSIQYVYGNANVANNEGTVHVVARTQQNSQATSLYDTLAGLQMIGKAFLGGSKSPDKQVYVRMIDNAKFEVKGNEVTFDLAVPQSDIDILVGMFGK